MNEQPCPDCGHDIKRHKARIPGNQDGKDFVGSLDCLDCDCTHPFVAEKTPQEEMREVPEWIFLEPPKRGRFFQRRPEWAEHLENPYGRGT